MRFVSFPLSNKRFRPALLYLTRDGRAIRDDNFQWIKPAFAELHRVLKRDSFCAFFYGWAHIHKFTAAFTEAGFRPIGHLIFPKPYTSGTRFLRYQHKCAHLLAKGEPKEPEHPTADIIQWTHYTGNKLHPSQKPLNVLLPLIRRTGAVWARAGRRRRVTVRARYARFTKRTAARRAFRTC